MVETKKGDLLYTIAVKATWVTFQKMCARQGTEVMENRVNRTMSISSKMAVDMVEDLWKRLGELEGRFRKADEVAFSEESTREDLLKAKLELAQIVGILEKFQFDEVDAVVTHNLSSGRDEVRQQRKDLTRAVTALGEEAVSKHAQVVELVTMMGQQP